MKRKKPYLRRKAIVALITLAVLASPTRAAGAVTVLGSSADDSVRPFAPVGFRLPYTAEVDYLRSDGLCRILSPVSIDDSILAQGVVIYLSVALPNAGNNAGLLAQGTSLVDAPWSLACYTSPGAFKLYSVGKFNHSFTGLTSKIDITVEIDSKNVYATAGGVRRGGAYATIPYAASLTILGYDSQSSSAPTGTLLYSFQMFVGGELRVDLTPVRLRSTGYMYDRVSHRMIGNSGIGTFTLGPDKENQ